MDLTNSIKNHTWYCFDDIIKSRDFNLNNILIDEKLYENTLIHNISFKTLVDAKPLRIRFDKIDEFVRVYDGTRYLVLFGSEKYNASYNRIRYFLSHKSGITYVLFFFHYYAKIKVDSYHYLPIEKTLTLHNVIIHI